MEQPPHHQNDTLNPGQRIGHYEVISIIGTGGMGEVYRAHDHKLGRDVAVKVIPARYSDNPSRARRFAAEARTTGSVSHPNIVSVYDAGEIDGRAYLVTELLHGDTLRALLERSGRLPVPAAINYSVQIARGLAAAHDRGIIHRDLKPSNIFVTEDGHLKILDFGLAKLVRREWSGRDDDDETISMVSNPGTILGSVGYMSPEQVEARPADQRSDIFALGAIIYEMLAGRRAFSGSSPVATLGSILKNHPEDLRTLRPGIPHTLALIVTRCLEKRPDDRVQSARDLVFSLEPLAGAEEPTFASVAKAAMHLAVMRLVQKPSLSAAAISILAASIFVVLAINWTPTEATRHDQPRAVVASPPEIERLTSDGIAGRTVGISPDASYVAFEIEGALWLTHIPTRSAIQITKGSPPVAGPIRVSPDGNFVYFIGWEDAGGVTSLYRVPILGGDPQLVVTNVSSEVLTFSPDGSRVAFERESDDGSALHAAAADGSSETRIATLAKPATFSACSWSPDGSRLICQISNEFNRTVMSLVDVASGRVDQLPGMPQLESVEWLPDGRSVVGLETVGHRLQVVRATLREKTTRRLTNDLSMYQTLSVSRDGTTIAASRLDWTTNLWSLSTEGDLDLSQLTTGVNTLDGNWGVTTTPDGRIVWASGASGKSADLMVANLDGSDRRRLTFDDTTDEVWPEVDPTGTFVIYMRRHWGEDGHSDIWRVDLTGSTPRPVTTVGSATNPRFSADGHSIHFTQYIERETYAFRTPAEGGAIEKLFDEPAHAVNPSPDGKWILLNTNRGPELRSIDGSSEPRSLRIGLRQWRPDSRAFVYMSGGEGKRNLFLQELSAAAPRQITNFPKNDIVAWGFDFTHDGKRILFARRSETRDIVILKEAR